MMSRDQAKAELLRWHHWSVELRTAGYRNNNAATVRNLLRRALDGSNGPSRYGSARGAWVDGPDFDCHAVEALVDGFVELYKALVRSELPDSKRLSGLFDAVEFLPFELMHDGPSTVEEYLNSYSDVFPELVPMALVFRHRLRGGAA